MDRLRNMMHIYTMNIIHVKFIVCNKKSYKITTSIFKILFLNYINVFIYCFI